MKIIVATTSKPKLEYLSEVLGELGHDIQLVPVDVKSDVSDQPLSEIETKSGSINRAKNALGCIDNADFSIGIEVGYHPDSNGKYEIFCFATIVDGNGTQLSSESHRLLLPDFHQNILKEGKDLGSYVRQFLYENSDEYSQNIGEDIRTRKSFIKSAVKSVISEYLG